jgi:hypothetical protein
MILHVCSPSRNKSFEGTPQRLAFRFAMLGSGFTLLDKVSRADALSPLDYKEPQLTLYLRTTVDCACRSGSSRAQTRPVICARTCSSSCAPLTARQAKPSGLRAIVIHKPYASPGSDFLQGRHSALIAALEFCTTIPHHALLHSDKLFVLDTACICPNIQDKRSHYQQTTRRTHETANMRCKYDSPEPCPLDTADKYIGPHA